ncbi:MAG: Ig-like domain-containing protein [Clostridia bacterium]|nr:Ig-like domain-containing protein [Clostridia bacterium]
MSIYLTVKKALSAILVFAVLLGAFVFLPTVKGAEVTSDSGYYTWSGYSTWLKGAGTETNPFKISTPSDLAYFRKQVATADATITYYAGNDPTTTAKTKAAQNSYYKLTCDIYYNDPNGDEWKSWSSTVKPTNGGDSAHTWAPPGYNDESTARFEGDFDGAGYTIYGMYIVHTDKSCVGFIGCARYATIKNLTLAKGYVEGTSLVGGFLGQAKVGVDIVNCVSELRVVGTSGVGGFIGGNAKNSSSMEGTIDPMAEVNVPSAAFYGCTNNSDVTAVRWAGGMIGYISAGASRMQAEKCVNNGKITASSKAAGGIFGGTFTVDGYGHNVIENCVNNGTVKGGNSYYTGGIVGTGRATEIYSCVNNGDISATGQYTGGISGGNNSADSLANGKIYNCYNTGKVTGADYTGGIVGVAKSVNINSCANVGAVKGAAYVGGISGKSGGAADKRDTELYNCYNTGSVTSTNGSVSVAGIVGEAFFEGDLTDNKYVKVKRCFNVGTVSSGRAIAYSSSTLKNSAGTGLYVLTQYASTCFGLSGVNSNFDGGTAVSSLATSEVLAALNSADAANPINFRAGYPFPTLVKIDSMLQNHGGRAELLGTAGVVAAEGPALKVSVKINTAGSYYSTLSGKSVSYGVLAVKSETLGNAELSVDTAGAASYTGTESGGVCTVSISDISADEYDDMYTLRPYATFSADGQTFYVYGGTSETSFYSAEGAENVAAINETAAFTCEDKLYLLVGGSDNMEYTLSSASREDSLTFISSDPSVATVASGKVTGVSAGTATITVTYTGDWGAKTLHCTVTVMEDLAEKVVANTYAEQDGKLRIRTNELHQISNSISKNDGSVLDYNGTVMMIDGGNKNSKSLEYLLELREEFLADGLASGALSEAEYHRHLLSEKCQVQFISFITHFHSDHINALRYFVCNSPFVTVKKMYAVKDPANTAAAGYDSYVNSFNTMVTNMQVYSPDLVPTRLSYETEKVRYFTGYNTLSTTDSSYPIKVTICTGKDWSSHSTFKSNSTVWENCSSTWYLIEYAGKRILYTGDSYYNDSGTTYKGNVTSGTSSVDHMLSIHKAVLGTHVDFLSCNHHGRGAFVGNLYTATTPSIVFAGVYFGQEGVDMLDAAVSTANIYLGGDGAHVFRIDASGGIDTSGATAAYNANTSGHAIRNHITMHYNRELKEKTPTPTKVAATGISLSAQSMTVPVGERSWLAATVLGDDATDKNVLWTVSDPTVLTTDGAYITALKAGTVTVTATSFSGGYSATCTVTVGVPDGDVNGDGTVSSADVIVLRLVIVGAQEESKLILLKGDLDMNGSITVADYMAIKAILK